MRTAIISASSVLSGWSLSIALRHEPHEALWGIGLALMVGVLTYGLARKDESETTTPR